MCAAKSPGRRVAKPIRSQRLRKRIDSIFAICLVDNVPLGAQGSQRGKESSTDESREDLMRLRLPLPLLSFLLFFFVLFWAASSARAVRASV